MKTFEIYFKDLNEEAQKEYLEFIGGETELQRSLPIVTVTILIEE